MFVSFAYLAFRALLGLLVRSRRGPGTRDIELIVLRHELEEITIIRTPVRAPKANAIAERFVRTVRAECLDWPLILSPRHLERVLRVYVDHYNRQRPHRALDLRTPDPDTQPAQSTSGQIRRTDRLGGRYPGTRSR